MDTEAAPRHANEALHRLLRRARSVACAARRHPLITAILVGAIVTIGAAAFLHPTYDTNDDPVMGLIASGTLTGSPSPHLIFTNVTIGAVLAGLESAVGVVGWYGVYLYSVHAAAITAVVFVALADDRTVRRTSLIGLGALLLAAEAPMLLRLQFTSASLLLGFAAMSLFLGATPAGRIAPIAAGVLLGAASLIRWESFWAVLIVALPVLGLAARRIPWRRWAVFATAAGGIVLAGVLAGAVAYGGSAQWQEYQDFNQARGALHSTVRMQSPALDDPSLAASVGWSPNDMRMFRALLFSDPTIYTTDALETIVDATGGTRNPVPDGFGALFEGATRWLLWALAAAAAAAAIIRFRGRGLILTAAALGWTAAVAVGLHATVKLPDRVALPLLAWAALILVLSPESAVGPSDESGAAGRSALITSLIGSLVVAGIGATLLVGIVRDGANRDDKLGRALESLEVIAGPGGTVVEWPGSLRFGFASPWRDIEDTDVRLILNGWYTFSPGYDQALARAGIDDLYVAIAERDDVVLTNRAGNDARIRRLQSFYAEHYDFDGVARFTGRLRGVQADVFDRVLAFTTDGSGDLIEWGPSGPIASYRRADGTILGVVTRNGEMLQGSAVDGLTGDAPEQIIVLDGDRTIAVVIPGADGAFELTMPQGTSEPVVYATIDDRAARLP